jgi:hypothetical protein
MYRNGSIYTAADPFATAMVVDGDTVAWVGSEQAATSIADSSMEIIDLRGALLAPGFVDSHAHLTETGLALSGLQLASVRSAKELLDAVASASGSGSRSGPWLGRDDVERPHTAHSWRRSTGQPAVGTSTSRASTCTQPWYRPHWPQRQRLNSHRRLLRDCPCGAGSPHSSPAGGAAVAGRRAAHATRHQALQEAASHGYVAVAEMAAPHISAVRTIFGWRRPGMTTRTRPEVLPYWGELAGPPRITPRQSWMAWEPRVLGLAGDLNMDGSIGSRTASLMNDYCRRTRPPRQLVPLGGRCRHTPCGHILAGRPSWFPCHRRCRAGLPCWTPWMQPQPR